MKRLDFFRHNVTNNPFYSKLSKVLSEAEFDEVVSFIEENDNLEYLNFEQKVNRLGLDQGYDKKKRSKLFVMQDLLLMANTVHAFKRSRNG
jgi:hypothetical protein